MLIAQLASGQEDELYVSAHTTLNTIHNTDRSEITEINNIVLVPSKSFIIVEHIKAQKKSIFVYLNKQVLDGKTIYQLKLNNWQVAEIIFEKIPGEGLFMRFIPLAPNENLMILGPLKRIKGE